MTAAYHECLKQEKEKIQKMVADACGKDNSVQVGGEALANCIEKGKMVQISDEANNRCKHQAAVAAGYETEPLAPPAKKTIPNMEAFGGDAIPFTAPAQGDSPPSPAPRKISVDPPTQSPDPSPSPDPSSEDPASKIQAESAPPLPTSGFTDSVTGAEIEADQDVARCVSSQSNANDCCNNPISCSSQLNKSDQNSLGALGGMLGSGAQNGGLTDYCQQMNSLGSNTGNVNTGLASICFGSHSACTTTCSGLAQKYKTLLDDCDGCAAESVYQSAKSALESGRTTCENLKTKSDQLAITGLGTANNQAVAEYCNKTASSPSGLSGPSGTPSGPPTPFINHLLAYNCEANPNSQDCKILPPAAKGESGFRENDMNSAKKNRDFNVADVSGAFKGYSNNTQNPEAGRNLLRGPVVANNSGGQIPGQNGSAQFMAVLPPKSHAAQAASTLNPNIDGGYQGGGGYSQPSGPAANDGDGYMPMGGNGAQFEAGLDLRQFLPGGSRAAMRRLAGIGEINAKEENIFLRISNKMMEKCRLGVLWQCH